MSRHSIDHIIYGVHDLNKGIAEIEALTGVKPAEGGQHQHFGTHNALLSLGRDAYLEIIAADPTQAQPDNPRPFGLDDLTQPGLIGWVATAPGIEQRAEGARERGYDPGQVIEGARQTPEGGTISWQITFGEPLMRGGAVPMLIDWGKTPSPATTSPQGCSITKLEVFHPDPYVENSKLTALGLDLAIQPAEAFHMRATLQTPKGEIILV